MRILSFTVLFLALTWAAILRADDAPPEKEKAPEINVGERLFLDTRFAQFFAVHASDPNHELARGDPVMEVTRRADGDLAGPFTGKSMNCRACHLVDEQLKSPGGGMRTYADFAARSPIPDRGDGRTTTLRNSPAQVNASVARDGMSFHFDGEFATMEDLVIGTLTGRNFGWLPAEAKEARAQIARIIRADDGQFPLSAESGGAYAKVLKGADAGIPAKYRLPEAYRLDIASASDSQIIDEVARLIAAYVIDLKFHQDERGYDRSPYDVFLRKNDLPAAPEKGESPLNYGERLFARLSSAEHFKWVTGQDGTFKSHQQAFAFGETELRGLLIFLRQPQADEKQTSGVGNCIACHQPPHFTDFSFHNTGVAQEEYDAVHGAGAFAGISIPDFAERQRLSDNLPATDLSVFADIPSKEKPGHTDLGLWNVFQSAGFPRPQVSLLRIVRLQHPGITDPKDLLPLTIATFKTPGLRDLGHSAPYFHTGRFADLPRAVEFYVRMSKLARAHEVRNGDPHLSEIHLSAEDAAVVAAFLRALNEDYE